jgi:putative transposase
VIALAERINGILSQEFLLYTYRNKQKSVKLLNELVHVYNDERLHLSLNMQTPNQVHKIAEEETLLRL